MTTMKMKLRGQLTILVAVGAIVAGVVGCLIGPKNPKMQEDKVLRWESLDGDNGSDLQRTPTPTGWLVENADGYLMVIQDPDHKWLKDN